MVIDFQDPNTEENKVLLSRPPSLSDYRSFYLFGLLPSRQISVGKACLDQVPLRVKSYISFEDALFTALSSGLYSPRSLEVWCKDAK